MTTGTGAVSDLPGAGPVGPPVLARAAPDRAIEHRADPQWLAGVWPSARLLRLGPDGSAAVSGDHLVWTDPTPEEAPEGALLLGVLDGVAYFARVLERPEPGASNLRDVGAVLDAVDAALFTHAVALANWHRTHRRCPRCGAPTRVSQAGAVRVCTADGSEHFPRTDPAIIVLVTDRTGERAVLGRQPTWPPGRYSCLAGFVEPGESAEQAVAREVREEAGLLVHSVHYIGSQPWPFPASLMLGYFAVTDDEAPFNGDGELEDVRWFTRDQLRAGRADGSMLTAPPVSIAHLLVSTWLGEA